MGIPGCGKSRVAEEYSARGYLRLNRDERGGSLRDLAKALEEELSSQAVRIVLDNTYLTRAARSYVVEAAHRHGARARCIWLDTPLAQAQVNLVERLLDRFQSSPHRSSSGWRRGASPACSRRRRRCARSVSWSRRRRTRLGRRGAGGLRAHAIVTQAGRRARRGGCGRPSPVEGVARAGRHSCAHLVFDWNPEGDDGALRTAVGLLSADISGPVGPPSARTRPARPAGVARRSPASPLRSPAHTASIRLARPSSERRPHTARSLRPWARATPPCDRRFRRPRTVGDTCGKGDGMRRAEPIGELDARFSSEGAAPTEWTEAHERLADAEIFWISTVRGTGVRT